MWSAFAAAPSRTSGINSSLFGDEMYRNHAALVRFICVLILLCRHSSRSDVHLKLLHRLNELLKVRCIQRRLGGSGPARPPSLPDQTDQKSRLSPETRRRPSHVGQIFNPPRCLKVKHRQRRGENSDWPQLRLNERQSRSNHL